MYPRPRDDQSQAIQSNDSPPSPSSAPRLLWTLPHFRLSPTWFWEARTRILLWYASLLLGTAAVALPLMTYRTFRAVDERVYKDITANRLAFQRLRRGEFSDVNRAMIEQFSTDPTRAKFTLTPQTPAEFKTLADVFLRSHIPEDDTFLVAIVERGFYKSSPRALPDSLRPGHPWLDYLKRLEQVQTGELVTQDPRVGKILYQVEPVIAGDRTLGTLLLIHTTAGERQEVLSTLHEVGRVLLLVVSLALVLGWWLSGRVLAPLRTLAVTAQRVSETDLSHRIPIYGRGDLSNLAHTFNEMMERLEAAFQTQRHLLNDVGHELRTPLTIIRGHLELMGEEPEEVHETRDLVIDELDRMSRLVDELILLARSERPDFLRYETLLLPRFMEELLAKVQGLGERVWQLDTVATGELNGDRQRLTEAMLNLAENAFHHTTSVDTIALGCRYAGEHLHLWVRDTGEGISPTDQTRIFERFARAAHRGRSDGSGLGLSIVRAIAEAHGGQVTLRSQLGQGSTFTLVLPLKR